MYIYIYMNIYIYVYIYISFFTSISRESSELLTAPPRLDAASMMATVECPRHLSAPLLLPEASQHVAHAYVWSSPGDNIKCPLFCPSFRVSFPVIRPWMACIACTTGFGFWRAELQALSPHPRLRDSPTTWQFKKDGLWPRHPRLKEAVTVVLGDLQQPMCDFRVLQFETSRTLHPFLLWSFASGPLFFFFAIVGPLKFPKKTVDFCRST